MLRDRTEWHRPKSGSAQGTLEKSEGKHKEENSKGQGWLLIRYLK